MDPRFGKDEIWMEGAESGFIERFSSSRGCGFLAVIWGCPFVPAQVLGRGGTAGQARCW